MSIELKHLEGLIRLCETASPAELRQIRAKLLKQLRSNKLGRLSPRDDAKLRELWSQLNCGEPYPEIPSSILGGSDYYVLTIAALALLIIMVFLTRWLDTNAADNTSSLHNHWILNKIPARSREESFMYSVMYAWYTIMGRSIDPLNDLEKGSNFEGIWKEFDLNPHWDTDKLYMGMYTKLDYLSNTLRGSLAYFKKSEWVSRKIGNLKDALDPPGKECIILVNVLSSPLEAEALEAEPLEAEPLEVEPPEAKIPSSFVIVRHNAYIYLIDASNKWGDVQKWIDKNQEAAGAGILVTFGDASRVEEFVRTYYPGWPNSEMYIAELRT